jgi:hypothetical protein
MSPPLRSISPPKEKRGKIMARSVPGTVTVVENLGDATHVGVRYGDILLMASVPVTDDSNRAAKFN